ncbi:hypothetical protein [uncultured Erythrobacter sp.]|uniref:hypothetical protein n=1 Tax=uncultured Erythrobacter sp. TaxID=263913 RepID=UPI002628FF12|nr:hypothetical protein [uncultured Erythrobacter sp.]
MTTLSERTWSVIGSVSWIAAAIIIVLGLVSYASIQSELNDARETIASAQEAQREAELVSAQLDSQLDAYDAAARVMQQHIAQRGKEALDKQVILQRLCQRHSASQNSAVQSICSNVKNLVTEDPRLEFLTIQNEAVTERGRGQFKQSLSSYNKALTALKSIEPNFSGQNGAYELQQMTLVEGKAFAHFREGNFAQARDELEVAFALENTLSRAVSGFLLSTDLKLRCIMGLAEGEATSRYESYLDRLDAAISTEESILDRNSLATDRTRKSWIQFREEDRDYFKDDKELKLLCNIP